MKFNKKKIVVVMLLNIALVGIGYFLINLPTPERKTSKAAEAPIDENQRLKYVPDEVIVKFKQNVGELNNSNLGRVAQKVQSESKSTVQIKKAEKVFKKKIIDQGEDRIYKVTVESDLSSEVVAQELLKSEEVEYAEPNLILYPSYTPNDPYYSDHWTTGGQTPNRDPNWNPEYDYQWDLKQINMQTAWDQTLGSENVVVAVLDTGVDYNHPELAGKVIKGYDYVNSDTDPMDDHGHGTHVSGIIAAKTNNSLGIAGVCPNCKILAIKVADETGASDIVNIASGIVEAVDSGSRIINLSLGAIGNSLVLETAATYAYARNAILVTAAGNSAADSRTFTPNNISCITPSDPGADCTLGVGATDASSKRSTYSNWGADVDVVAPGGGYLQDVISTKSSQNTLPSQYYIGSQFVRLSGTSMAAPHVAGLAGLILSKNSSLTAKQIRNVILNSSTDLGQPGVDYGYGTGLINAGNALSQMNTADRPIVAIASPFSGFLIGKTFDVYGTVAAPNFTGYKVEYAPDNTQNWTQSGVASTNESQGRNKKLASVNFGSSPAGIYKLRLTVTSGSSQLSSEIYVYYDSRIRSNFPIKFGSQMITGEPIISDLNQDGKQEIMFKDNSEAKIKVYDSNGNSVPGWPKSTSEQNPEKYQGSLGIVADINSSLAGKEVFIPVSFTGFGGQMLGFKANGQSIPNWGVENWGEGIRTNWGYIEQRMSVLNVSGHLMAFYPETWISHVDRLPRFRIFNTDYPEYKLWSEEPEGQFQFSSTSSDLNNDGTDEIIISHYDKDATDKYSIREYDVDGNLRHSLVTQSYTRVLTSADLDKDGTKEIIALTESQDKARVYVLNNNLVPKSGWPKELPDRPEIGGAINIADMTGDSLPEIVVFADDTVYVLNSQGSTVAQQKIGYSFKTNRMVTVSTSQNTALIAMAVESSRDSGLQS